MNERSEYRIEGRRGGPSPHQLEADCRLDTPEKRLMIAILADAINCFQKYAAARNRRNRRVVHEAEKWLMSADRSWPFSFENICDILAIDSQRLRSNLQRGVRAAAQAA
jgi:hypothetical protein